MEPEKTVEPTLVNWAAIEERLFTFSHEALIRFGNEHSGVICSFLAYDVDLPFFHLSFDTPANAVHVAQRTEQEAIVRRARILALPTAWHGAKDFSTQPPVLDYSYSTGYFAYDAFSTVKVGELEDLHFAEDYPQDDWGDDYAEGNTRIVLWKVIERLIDSEEFHQLRLASPFRLGYQMHDDALTVLRILNWPHLH